MFYIKTMSKLSTTNSCDGMLSSAAVFDNRQIPLPDNYQLRDNDVFCGRGSLCFNHAGNVRFRELIDINLERYINSEKKYEKSSILHELVDYVRSTSTGSGFVSKDFQTGRYYEINDSLAREKTSQAFRDATKGKYKSSRLAKLKKETTFRCDSSHLDDVNCTPNNHTSGLSSDIGSYNKSDFQQNIQDYAMSSDITSAVFQQQRLDSCADPVMSTTTPFASAELSNEDTDTKFNFSEEYVSYVRNQEIASQISGSDKTSKMSSTADSIGDELLSCSEEYLALVFKNAKTSHEEQSKSMMPTKSAHQQGGHRKYRNDNSNYCEMYESTNDSKTFDLLLKFTEKLDDNGFEIYT